jgi:hypothetical protein
MAVPNQQAHEELIQRSLDGELSPADQRKLSELLASSDQIRTSYDRLKQVDALLVSAPAVDPPQGMAGSVMARLRASHAPVRTSTSIGVWARITAALRARPAYGVSLGFALGVLVLLPIMVQSPQQFLDPASITGTMTNGNHASRGFEARPLPISLDQATGQCQALITDDGVTVILELETAGPLEIEVTHEGTKPGLASLLVSSGTTRYVEALGQRVRLWHQGSDVYRLKLRREPGVALELHLSLLRDGEVLFEGGIPVQAMEN